MKKLLFAILTVTSLNASAATWNETTNADLNDYISITSESVIDSSSDLEWLMFDTGDTNFTLGFSLQEAEDSYSDFGWKLATETQVNDLFDTFFSGLYVDSGDGSQSGIPESETSKIIQSRNSWLLAFGNDAIIADDGTVAFNDDNPNVIYSTGAYLADDGTLGISGIKIDFDFDELSLFTTLYGPGFTFTDPNPLNSSYSGDGVFMVRDYAVVPIPAAIWLFGTGLIALFGLARRKA